MWTVVACLQVVDLVITKQMPCLGFRSLSFAPPTASFCHQAQTIVNRGDWFGSLANIKGANKDAKI